MDEDRKPEHSEAWQDRTPSKTTRWLVILSALFLAAAVGGIGYAYEQSVALSDLTLQNQSLRSTMDQMRSQMGTLTTKLDQMTAPPAPADAPTGGDTAQPKTKRAAAAATPAPQDRRIKRLQAQLNQQKKQLKDTQDEIASARSDLEGKIGSTRDELNGSIAKNHDELVALEKRGERSFFEFDLSKSKQFQREGPIQVSLRKADTKHQSYDLMLLVDDHELSKKKVDLYEPIWLHQSDQPQPLQIVVNSIGRNRVHGYVSAPKYRESELAASAAAPTPEAAAATSTSPEPASSPSSPAETQVNGTPVN